MRELRIEKAKKLEKGWELLRMCKEMIKKDGVNWQISKERRENERRQEWEKKERLETAKRKQNEWKTRNLQTKITDTLEKLPKNRIELIRREEEKTRRFMLIEAKQELWKKWRKNVGNITKKDPKNKKRSTKNQKEDQKEQEMK